MRSGRGADVVGICSQEAAIVRLVGALLLKQKAARCGRLNRIRRRVELTRFRGRVLGWVQPLGWVLLSYSTGER